MTSDEGQDRSEARQRRIVVGVDGSPASREALRWAVAQAEATGAVVDAVITWQPTPVYGWSFPAVDPDLAAASGAALAESVRSVAGSEPPVEIREHTVCGHPAQVLLDTADGAELLVLGSRGHGGFTGALLGSVGQHCAQHARCPVVIVPHGRD